MKCLAIHRLQPAWTANSCTLTRHSEVRHGGIWSELHRLEGLFHSSKPTSGQHDNMLWNLPPLRKPVFWRDKDSWVNRATHHYYSEEDQHMSYPHWNAKFGKWQRGGPAHHIELYMLTELRAVNILMASIQGSLIDALYDLPADPSRYEVHLCKGRGGVQGAHMSISPCGSQMNTRRCMKTQWTTACGSVPQSL